MKYLLLFLSISAVIGVTALYGVSMYAMDSRNKGFK